MNTGYNGVRIVRRAAEHYVEATIGGKSSRIDLTTYTPDERGRIAQAALEWKQNNFRGFPSLLA